MHSRFSKSLVQVLALALVAVAPVVLAAQDAPKAKKAAFDSPSKLDIFVGYSYLAPKGTINTPIGNGIFPTNYSSVNYGSIFSSAYYFSNYFGVTGIGDFHLQNENPNAAGQWTGPRNNFSGGSLGVIFRYPTKEVTPFAHALVGAEVVGGPHWQLNTWGPVLTAGGGLDYATPLFDHHLAIRLFEADYQYTHEDYGTSTFGGRANINIARLSAGIVWRSGAIAPPPPVTLACSASPALVFPGEPVTVTATAGDLNPKLTPVYTWTGTGVTGSGTTATVATSALAAGTYTVKGEVVEGPKAGQTADCSATFTVKAFEPPTISCSASPSTIKPGDTATVTAVGVSPQNRPLTYSYSASAGSVSGTGTSAVFSSAGAPTGAVGITCNVSDDKSQTATASTSVTITAPYVAPAPKTSTLCSITFTKDAKRPTRVDNEAKACLDEVALDLQRQSDAKVIVVGESDAKEKAKTEKETAFAAKHKKAKVEDSAALRAVNTKEYLVTDKGIDASRVTVMTGTSDGQTVEDYLVPAGASFDVTGTTVVDETAVKPVVRKPLGAKPTHHHSKVGGVKPPVTN